jgi:tetratricopeptide (TPR) repeat protein
MAPEQAEGDIRAVGVEADVYSLGAILYGLLTGRPPFLGATAIKTLALVKTAEPVPPSQLQPGLPPDIETICLKCLNKAPARRYVLAEALAEDLRRFRAREPINARPTTAWECAWKWARRRPGTAMGLGSTVAAVLLVLAGALYYNSRLRVAVTTARAAERAAEANARDALTQRNLALKALNELVFNVQERLGDSPATRQLRKGLLDTAIAGLDEITRSNDASAPDLSRAVAHQKLGDIFHQVGRTADARRQLEQAHRLAEQLAVGSPGDLAIAECLERACLGLGEMSLSAGQYGEAKTYFHRGVDLAESITRTDPNRPEARRGLLQGYFQLGRSYSFSGALPEAEVWFRKMHDLAERWSEEDPENTRARDMLASSYRKLADIRKLSHDFPAARDDYLKAVAIGRTLLETDPESIESKANLATALNDLANIAYLCRDFAEARPPYREAERLFSELVAADPDNLAIQIRLILAQIDVGRLERDESRFAAAVDFYGRALERLLRLERQGRLEGHPIFKTQRIPELRDEIANCEAAPIALESLDAVRSRPPRVATRLLLIRAKLLSAQRRQPELLATVEALCDLDLKDPEDCLTLARSRAVCLNLLGTSPDRSSLRTRCTDRALAALDRAIALGFRDADRLEKDDDLAPLRAIPGYQARVDRIKDFARRSK